jgi:N-acetylglucosamine-6-phosphate deacetylase
MTDTNPNDLGFSTELSKNTIDVHCHGIGRFDFTRIQALDLEEIEAILAKRKQYAILTLYLPKPDFDRFLQVMVSFHQGRRQGKYPHILGFGLEGPFIASHGGTPEEGVWLPSQQHWQAIAECGRYGLAYTILSPDAHSPASNLYTTASQPSLTWIAETLLEGGVLPVPGHFTKSDPVASANALQSLFDVVAAWGVMPTITDHLFNDMPLKFKHAWRTPEEKMRRDRELDALKLASWSLENLTEFMGPVPATIMTNAMKGLVKVCINFDGEHVDLAIVKKAIDLIGSENMIMMTDSIESRKLADHELHMKPGSSLLYQGQEIVAAGSQGINAQISNMIHMGLTQTQIKNMTHTVPQHILRSRETYIQHHYAETYSL